ncbi:hypothetical protein AVEN_132576-1 [Araneus ventricosus]|uniref:Uncharacterized protein n=1 Tax=Araneus ventricosus TaxID=182803 RepID=A0A4Y2T0Y2_ARAVE|nr:hypothetical protein AVEN_132576-1 [Araneus ventricosus]
MNGRIDNYTLVLKTASENLLMIRRELMRVINEVMCTFDDWRDSTTVTKGFLISFRDELYLSFSSAVTSGFIVSTTIRTLQRTSLHSFDESQMEETEDMPR